MKTFTAVTTVTLAMAMAVNASPMVNYFVKGFGGECRKYLPAYTEDGAQGLKDCLGSTIPGFDENNSEHISGPDIPAWWPGSGNPNLHPGEIEKRGFFDAIGQALVQTIAGIPATVTTYVAGQAFVPHPFGIGEEHDGARILEAAHKHEGKKHDILLAYVHDLEAAGEKAFAAAQGFVSKDEPKAEKAMAVAAKKIEMAEKMIEKLASKSS